MSRCDGTRDAPPKQATRGTVRKSRPTARKLTAPPDPVNALAASASQVAEPAVCFEFGCYAVGAYHDWRGDADYCARHLPVAFTIGFLARPVPLDPVLTFHTPPGRRGVHCDVAFAFLAEPLLVVRRTQDRLAGGTTYTVAYPADLEREQHDEIASRTWYPVSAEGHAMLAALDPEPPAVQEGAART